MPALPPVPNVFRLTTSFVIGSQQGIFRTFWQYTGGPPTNPDMSTIVTSMHNALGSSGVGASAGSNVQYTTSTGEDLSSLSGAVASGGATQAGGRPTPTEPALSAIHVKFALTRRYRGGHPGVYLPGAGNADITTPTLWAGAVISLLAT